MDIARSQPDLDLDLPKVAAGGLDAEFFSIFVFPKAFKPAEYYTEALRQIDAVERVARANPQRMRVARTAAEVRANAAAGILSALIGVEGGHVLGPADPATQLDRLRTLASRGARYMTLTWSTSNDIGGSSSDDGDVRGLTPFGRDVIVEMNKLGIIVDISHVSDPTFWDAVRASRKPVLASHSSSRALTNVPRNMTDAMLKAVAQNGGAACVNFGASFLDEAFTSASRRSGPSRAPPTDWPPGARCAPTARASRRACRCRGSSITSSTWSRSPASTTSVWEATSMVCPRCPSASRTSASCRRSRRRCVRAGSRPRMSRRSWAATCSA